MCHWKYLKELCQAKKVLETGNKSGKHVDNSSNKNCIIDHLSEVCVCYEGSIQGTTTEFSVPQKEYHLGQ